MEKCGYVFTLICSNAAVEEGRNSRRREGKHEKKKGILRDLQVPGQDQALSSAP